LKTSLAIAFVLVLLVSVVAGAFLAVPVSANFFPETPPEGINIGSDGWVYGTDKISRSGNIYTLTGNIDGGITILADNIVLDGNGYTLKGTGGGSGLYLQGRDQVTIKNLKVMSFKYGMKFTWEYVGTSNSPQKSNTIIDNTLANNTYGVSVDDWMQANLFTNNRFEGNTYGVSFSGICGARNNVFKNNLFNDNQFSLFDDCGSPNDIDTSNLVNGKPVYYWVNKQDLTVPADAGLVVLKNCSRVTVQNLALSENGQGIHLSYTIDSKIIGNVFSDNAQGIFLRGSSNNEISKNTIKNSLRYGAYFYRGSNDNLFTECIVESSGEDGVYVEYECSGNVFSKNQILYSQKNGVSLGMTPSSQIIGNNITQNRGVGIILKYTADDTVVQGNYVSENGFGLLVETTGNTITQNTFMNNYGWAMRLNGSQTNNKIHHNNFIDNNVGEGLQVSMPAVWSFYSSDHYLHPSNGGLATSRPISDPTLKPGNPNSWDDGKEGNYWSDYMARYPNASAKGNIGDTPFFINENNQDNYPLMSPIGNINLDLPALTSSTSVTPTQNPSATVSESGPYNQPEPFSSALLAAGSGVVVVAVGVAVLLYFKNRGVVK